MHDDHILTTPHDDAASGPAIGTVDAACAAFLQERMQCSDAWSGADIAALLPLLVAYGLLGGQVPSALVETDAEDLVLRLGAIVCCATWRTYQGQAQMSAGGRLVVGVRRIYVAGPTGTTYAKPNPSPHTQRRIIRFSGWCLALLATRNLPAWVEAALHGDEVACAALAAHAAASEAAA
jgi:hypothetical protein